MMMSFSCLQGNKVRIQLIFFSTILLSLLWNEKILFEHINVAKAWYLKNYRHSLSAEEHWKAFHLEEKYFNKNSSNVKVILYWDAAFGHVGHVGNELNGCIFTYDRSAIEIADAVSFHFAESYDRPDKYPLDKRKPWQRWIWFCMESPISTRQIFAKTLTQLGGIFNWTMTYRADSDINAAYFMSPVMENKTIKELIAEKTAQDPVMWIVSNCRSAARMEYVQELKKYIDINLMGSCFDNPVCRRECMLNIIRRHKFYLSFENSRCKDYITEKFWWNGLSGGAVPVVMGPPREDYERLAPPNSFIHVDDFENERDLAEYLIMLDRNDTAYGEYLRWKSIPDSPGGKTSYNHIFGGDICAKLKQEKSENKVIEHLDLWWYGESQEENHKNSSTCKDDKSSGINYRPFLILGYISGVLILLLISMKMNNCFRPNTKQSFSQPHGN